MANDSHDEGHAPSKEDFGYVCHCRKCSGVVGMISATSPDVAKAVAKWLAMNNTYVERRRIPVIRRLDFCEVAWDQ